MLLAASAERHKPNLQVADRESVRERVELVPRLDAALLDARGQLHGIDWRHDNVAHNGEVARKGLTCRRKKWQPKNAPTAKSEKLLT